MTVFVTFTFVMYRTVLFDAHFWARLSVIVELWEIISKQERVLPYEDIEEGSFPMDSMDTQNVAILAEKTEIFLNGYLSDAVKAVDDGGNLEVLQYPLEVLVEEYPGLFVNGVFKVVAYEAAQDIELY